MTALEAHQDQRHDLDIGEARLLINWRIWSERCTITMRIKMAIHHCESVADPRVYACSFSTFFRELIALNYCIEVKCVVNLLKVIRTATVRFHFIVCQPTNWSMLEERNVAPTETVEISKNLFIYPLSNRSSRFALEIFKNFKDPFILFPSSLKF